MSFHEENNIKRRRRAALRSMRGTGSVILASLAFLAVLLSFFFSATNGAHHSETAIFSPSKVTETTGSHPSSTSPLAR
jgi:hypothetical protein